jgi:hypothetical protein
LVCNLPEFPEDALNGIEKLEKLFDFHEPKDFSARQHYYGKDGLWSFGGSLLFTESVGRIDTKTMQAYLDGPLSASVAGGILRRPTMLRFPTRECYRDSLTSGKTRPIWQDLFVVAIR